MADVAVQNPATGELRMVSEEDAPAFTEQTGWTVADQAQRERGARLLESGGVGQQALAAGETAVRTGTLGLVPGIKGWQQRAEVQAEEHPYVRMAATGVGALGAAAATGGVAGAAAGGLGISGAAATALTAGAEGLAGGAAQEVEDARNEVRDVSAGNIFLYGLGGEIAGRALPAAFKMGAGRVRAALTAAEEVAGEGVPSALAGVEARSVESQAQIARGLPEGPERAAALERTAPQQYDHLATEGAGAVEQFQGSADALAAPNKRLMERMKQALPDESPAQVNWFTEQKRQLSDEYLGLPGRRPAPATPATPAAAPVVPSAAEEYALDAARRRLRGVADHTGREDLGALAGEIGERSAAAKALPDEVKLAINQRTGSASLDDVTAWVKDPEALRAGHGLEAPAAAAPPSPAAPTALVGPVDLGAYGKDVRNIVRPGLRRMDGATSIAEQYFTARDMASQLEEVGSRIAKDKSLAPSLRDEMLASVRGRAESLRQGLTDESLFGGAAKLESDLSRGTTRMRQGLGEIESLSDPSKMRKYLQADRVDRARLSRKLDDALEGAEDLLATHEAHGTLDPKTIAEQRARISQIREARGIADEIQVARAGREVPGAASPEPGSPWKGLAGFALDQAVDFAPYPIRKLYQLGKRIKAIDEAARSATKQTARRLAGTGVATEASGLGNAFGKAVREEVAAAADRVIPGASKGAERIREILARQEGRAAEEGSVTIESGLNPKIDRLATKLQDRVSKLRELEGKAPVDDELDGLSQAHADRLERAQGHVEESLHALRDEYESRMGDLLSGETPDALKPKARAKYDRYRAGLDELDATLTKHGGGKETASFRGLNGEDRTTELFSIQNPGDAAEEWLKGRGKGSTEAGYASTGASLKGILTSPIGMTAALGTAALAAPKAIGALERFQGDFSGPEESFLAKKKLLDQDQVSPDTLFETLGASLEDLPKISPELFQQLSARVAQGMRYVRANLPPGIKTTLMYPDGIPPSTSALRDFATIWNTTMQPHSVLEDIDAGTATGLQMKTLRETHPDIYDQLHSDVVSEIGQNFRNVPLSTKLQMDILFDADGVAGPFFSSKAAGYIAQANKEIAARGPAPRESATPLDRMSSQAGPSGLGAIQSSVTNKGVAA